MSDGDSYFALFECAPVAIWHEDFSDVKRFLDGLRTSGVEDISGLVAADPEVVRECIRKIRVLHVNRMARDFYGAASEEELVRKLPNLFDDAALSIFRQEILQLVRGASSFEAEFTTRTLKGEERVVQMNVSLLPTPDRPWSRVIVAFTDLTERKKLETELLQSQKLESLGRLAGGVAHDLNNALTIINGYSDMLLEEGSHEQAATTALNEIRKAGDRAAALTQQLLAFSRKQVLQPVVVNLNDIITDAQDVLATATGEHIELVIVLADDLARTRVDPTQFYHVLLNLVLNARDAMPQGGKVEIRSANMHLDGAAAGVLSMMPGDYVVMTVADTGLGIDKEIQDRVFEPFFTTKASGKGTGLGLSSAFGITRQSGGAITCESLPGRGSTFSVYLPATAEAPETGITETHATAVGGPETILIVEDQPSVRGFLSDALRKYGYDVREAGNSAEALRCFEQHFESIKVVVTDIVMPGLPGPELVRQMMTIAPNLHVIYISGYTGGSHDSLEPDELQTTYLQKPFAADVLASAVRRMLSAAEGKTQ
jgi:PAS domain S-box-containing protein